jgi:hypothetical protein
MHTVAQTKPFVAAAREAGLTEEEIDDVVSYLRKIRLQETKSPEPEAAGRSALQAEVKAKVADIAR